MISKGPFTKDVQLTPGKEGSAESGRYCYSSVILLFYPDTGGGGSTNPGFSRTSFVNGP